MAWVLDTGAADYLVKPFSQTELAARILAAQCQLLYPFPGGPLGRSFALGDLSIDCARRTVSVAGEPVELTVIEYAVLYELAGHPPRVLNQGVCYRC